MITLDTRLPFWKILGIVIALVALGARGQSYGSSRSTRNFGNYGNYNSANSGTCGLMNSPFGFSGRYSSSRRTRQKKISSIDIADNISPPSWWNRGKEVYLSIEGGMKVKLKLKNFEQSLVNEVQAILFKDSHTLEEIYRHEMTSLDLVDTGSSKTSLTFTAPPLSTVRGQPYFSRREWELPLLMVVLTWDDEEVECQYERLCRLIYSYSYTPIIDYISNTVALA